MRVVLAIHLGVPKGGFDDLELAIEEHLLQLIDQQHRRIAKRRDVTRRYLDCQPFIRAVAEFLHDLAGLHAVFLHVGAIARQRFQDLLRHAPYPFGQGLHDSADIALPKDATAMTLTDEDGAVFQFDKVQ